MRAYQNSTESLPKPRVLELSHRDEGNYPGKGSKVWVPGRRLSTAEAEQEVACTGYESLQKAPVPWEDRVRGRGCRQSQAGKAFACHVKNTWICRKGGGGRQRRLSGVQRDPQTKLTTRRVIFTEVWIIKCPVSKDSR